MLGRTTHEVGSDDPVLLDLNVEGSAFLLDGGELAAEGGDAGFAFLLLLLLLIEHCKSRIEMSSRARDSLWTLGPPASMGETHL